MYAVLIFVSISFRPMDDTNSTQDEHSYQDDDTSKDSSAMMDQLKTDINEERRAKLREIEVNYVIHECNVSIILYLKISFQVTLLIVTNVDIYLIL